MPGPAALPRHFALRVTITSTTLLHNKPKSRSDRRTGETDRQLAKNAPIDVNQTAKQVPNTPPAQVGFEPGRSKFPKCAGVLRCSTRALLQRSTHGANRVASLAYDLLPWAPEAGPTQDRTGPNRTQVGILAVTKRPWHHETSTAHHKKPVLHAHINPLNI
jgi:hypothetical protein